MGGVEFSGSRITCDFWGGAVKGGVGEAWAGPGRGVGGVWAVVEYEAWAGVGEAWASGGRRPGAGWGYERPCGADFL